MNAEQPSGHGGGTERRMIDRERVEQFDFELAEAVAMGERAFLADTEIVAALSGIVEALAERDPYADFADTCGRLCLWCYESEQVDHAEDCEWAKAAALVGPAGEREEANG